MATKQSTIEYLLEQLANIQGVTARKMFGEYALQCDGKTVALICDDQLYVKPTDIGRSLVGEGHGAPPYPGAKVWLHITEDYWEDREWLTALLIQTIAAVPIPKPKKKKHG